MTIAWAQPQTEPWPGGNPQPSPTEEPTATPTPTPTLAPVFAASTSSGTRKYTRDPAIQVGEIQVEGVNFVGSRTTLSPGESVLLWIDTPVDYDSWTQGSDSGEELDDSLYGAWSQGGGNFSTASGYSTVWTAPSTPGTYVPKITVNDNPSYGSRNGRNDLLVEKTVTIKVAVVKVKSLQHAYIGGSFQDVNGQNIIVAHKQAHDFKALPDPVGSAFPDGKPEWGGEAAGSPPGEITSVTFTTASSSLSDVKSVSATAGGVTRTANAVVFSTAIQRNEEWSYENSARFPNAEVGGPQPIQYRSEDGNILTGQSTVVELQVNITPAGLNLLPSQSSRFGFRQEYQSTTYDTITGVGEVLTDSEPGFDPDFPDTNLDRDGQNTGDTFFAIDAPGQSTEVVEALFRDQPSTTKRTIRQDFTSRATYDDRPFGEKFHWTVITTATKNSDGTISWSGGR